MDRTPATKESYSARCAKSLTRTLLLVKQGKDQPGRCATVEAARGNAVTAHNHFMSEIDKYLVTLHCRPEDGCTAGPSLDKGECVVNYTIYANSKEEAVKSGFTAHMSHCDDPCGNCEIAAEAHIVCDNVFD